MTTVRGRLNDGVTGKIVVTPDHPFIDTSQTPEVLVATAMEGDINLGSFVIDVPQSENIATPGKPSEKGAAITYTWELFSVTSTTTYSFLNGDIYTGEDVVNNGGVLYTGKVYDPATSVQITKRTQEDRTLITSIHAICPDASGVVEFSQLVGINHQTPYMDISLLRLAEELTTNPTYRARISAQTSIRGDYSATTTYNQNDLIQYQGNSYIYTDPTPTRGNTPPTPPATNNAYWQLVAAKGDTGSGTSAAITGYNPITWTGSNQAASQGDVVDAIASVGNVDLTQYAKKNEVPPIKDAVFRGSTRRDPLLYPAPKTGADQVVDVGYLNKAINDSKSLLPRPLLYARRVGANSLTKGVATVVQWNNRKIYDPAVLGTNGIITIPEDGYYLFCCSLSFRINGTYSTNSTRSLIQALLLVGGTQVGKFFALDESSYNSAWFCQHQGWQVRQFTKGDQVSLAAYINGGAMSGGTFAYEGSTSGDNNFFLMWRF